MSEQSFYLAQGPLGLVGGYQGNSRAIKVVMGALVAILMYNAAELSVLILLTFRRYRGLYFWSLSLSTVLGLVPSGIGNLLHFFAIGPLWLALALSNIGFYFLIPGQSVVLYSRLHLVLYDQCILRLVLYAVVINTVLIGFPTTISTFGAAFVRTNDWSKSYKIIERLQVTWFCVQEFTISLLYIRETVKLLQLSPAHSTRRRRIMYELLAINVLIILMDISVLIVEFLGLYYLQVLLKCTIYSIKLKIEFAVLGKLTAIVEASRLDLADSGVNDLSDIPNRQQFTSTDPVRGVPVNRLSLDTTQRSKEIEV
ncbi:hypothetical protein N7481_012066 [Penicillium waksmanii]|uniref:uncharacterized protein n=1 Tax=Penicillium waksmanii TaxID=69791 RepID=UPI0025490439|nr:uncharacterized protein N7481_012066 [Penicillium waksmanii]KAJ5965352.1 hypothetical protein N7481_012066 [Penicillium waksmanii]